MNARLKVIALTLLIGTPALVRGEASVESRLAILAETIGKDLKKASHSSATLKVEGSSTFRSSGPAMVKEVLGAELEKHDIKILKLSGDVGIAVDVKHAVISSDTGMPSTLNVTISAKIVDHNDLPILSDQRQGGD